MCLVEPVVLVGFQGESESISFDVKVEVWRNVGICVSGGRFELADFQQHIPSTEFKFVQYRNKKYETKVLHELHKHSLSKHVSRNEVLKQSRFNGRVVVLWEK